MQYAASVFVGDIPKLRQFEFKDDHLQIGGKISLTDLDAVALKAIKHYGPEKGQVFAAMHKQLEYFAGRQIRNAGIPAGNLATASPISDLNPVMVAANATLISRSLEKETEIPMPAFFKAYRTTALEPDAIIAGLRIPIRAGNGYFQAYKQAKRKDDDIAIVNGAFRARLSKENVVGSMDLVYGGMAPLTTSANKAVEFLMGKAWTAPETLEGCMSALEEDFDLRFGVPGGMATYRKTLALSFVYAYSFYQEVLYKINGEVSELNNNVVPEIEREISHGVNDGKDTDAYTQTILGKKEPHFAALKQTTGTAQYTGDIPVQKNELYGCLVLWPSHAQSSSLSMLNLPWSFLVSTSWITRTCHRHTPTSGVRL